MNTTLNKFLLNTWYTQNIIVIDCKDTILSKTADLEKIKAAALYSGTNHDMRNDNPLMTRDVYNFGAIDSYLIIEVR